MITLVATLRGSDELEVANCYTYDQLHHIAGVHLKDKMFLLRIVADSLGVEHGKNISSTVQVPGKRKLPSWYRPRFKHGRPVRMNVVDLDGPMEHLAPYIGKGKIRKGSMRVPEAGSTRRSGKKRRR